MTPLHPQEKPALGTALGPGTVELSTTALQEKYRSLQQILISIYASKSSFLESF
jgi:hypothetical protein